MSEQFGEVRSLTQLENWGGDYPGEHLFSTLANMDNSDGRLDEAMQVANILTKKWVLPEVTKAAGLYLYGKPGTGKTHFAVGVGRILAEQGVDVSYLHLPSLNDNGIKNYGEGFASFTKQPAGQFGAVQNAHPSTIFSTQKFNPYNKNAEDLYINRGKSALLLDDYGPEHQKIAHSAIETAAERAGLVLITSNHTDPFGLLDIAKQVPLSDEQIVIRDMARRVDENAVQESEQYQHDKAREIRSSLSSRLAAMFKLIEFTGNDQRIEKSIWNF